MIDRNLNFCLKFSHFTNSNPEARLELEKNFSFVQFYIHPLVCIGPYMAFTISYDSLQY